MCKEFKKNPCILKLKGILVIVYYDNGCTLYTFNKLINQSFSIKKKPLKSYKCHSFLQHITE